MIDFKKQIEKHLNSITIFVLLIIWQLTLVAIAIPNEEPKSLNYQVVTNNIDTAKKSLLAINQLIISTKKPNTESQNQLENLNLTQKLGITKIKTLIPNKIFKLSFNQNINPYLINLLESQEWIAKVALNPIEKSQILAPDPLIISNPTTIMNPNYANILNIVAPQVKSNPIIAVIDSAFDPSQVDLSPNMLSGIDFADGDMDVSLPSLYKQGTSNQNIINRSLFHGSMVAGVIASANNQLGTVGVCPWCKIKPYKTSSDDDITQDTNGNYIAPGLYQDSMISSIYHAISKGIKIINISAGSNIYSSVYQEVIDYARDNGVIIVASSGNDNSNNLFWPASFDSVISVSSINKDLTKSSYSNYGQAVDISVPIDNGVVTPVYKNTQGVDLWSLRALGTSFASPVVSGIIGLIYSLYPGITPNTVRTLLKNPTLISSLNSSNPTYLDQLGVGLNPELFVTSLGLMNTINTPIQVLSSSTDYNPSRNNLPGFNIDQDLVLKLKDIQTLGADQSLNWVCQLYTKDYNANSWDILGSSQIYNPQTGCSTILQSSDRVNIAYMDIKWILKIPAVSGSNEFKEFEFRDLIVFEFNGIGMSN